MRLTRLIRVQLAVFSAVSLTAASIMIFGYLKVPALLFGIGRYTVTMQLARAGGLYPRANVTYRGTEVGRVSDVRLSDGEVAAALSLNSDITIPADVDAEVHSQSAIGEQYVELVPRSDRGPALKEGDVIPVDRTTVPPDISALLDATNRGLQAIPREALKTTIDESYLAVGGLGAELSRLVRGSTTLAVDAHAHQDELTSLIDRSKPVLDSQAESADAIQGWAAHLATISRQFQGQDAAVAGILRLGPAAAEGARSLIERVQPTIPTLLANLVSVGQVGLTYQPNLEQLLVLLPQIVAVAGGVEVANLNTKYKGIYLAFDLNVNLPPPCVTGYLPPQQRRTQVNEDYPDRPDGGIYCRIPQDASNDVRGARNLPCETRPGKRAPTVKMCESDENYVPLNDGNYWKGDPNATLSGQDIPQLPPGSAPQAAPAAPPPPIAAAQYNPATGTYFGPDGHEYTQADLAQTAPTHKSWQSMLTPPNGN
ncbi:MCE family protein [Mycobacterium sp. E796]|uniref:MCE family protein n=1 Tax=Mycobacterium sp. E796 TaxID=1834151 RepID=UPI00080175FF|nr:MlaD family protein [Mycobacterium sp. E796]OBI40451.1 mammalian cell entry protein [Mycobacterium sp. E796]